MTPAIGDGPFICHRVYTPKSVPCPHLENQGFSPSASQAQKSAARRHEPELLREPPVIGGHIGCWLGFGRVHPSALATALSGFEGRGISPPSFSQRSMARFLVASSVVDGLGLSTRDLADSSFKKSFMVRIQQHHFPAVRYSEISSDSARSQFSTSCPSLISHPSIQGGHNADAGRSRRSGSAVSPRCIPVTA